MGRLSLDPLNGEKVKLLPGVQAELWLKAETVKAAAKTFAPVETTDYVDSIQVRNENGTIMVLADNFKANWIEFGTGEPYPTPAYAPLRKGAWAAGFKLESRHGAV